MKLINRHYDTCGMSTGRMMRQRLYGNQRPLWHFSDELELKHLLALAVRQYFGYPIAYLITRYDRQWRKMLNGWRRLRPPPQKPGNVERNL